MNVDRLDAKASDETSGMVEIGLFEREQCVKLVPLEMDAALQFLATVALALCVACADRSAADPNPVDG
ncbi:MAG: hypothetical protein ACJ8R9_05375 [Steroidobacteraceae bacterium]